MRLRFAHRVVECGSDSNAPPMHPEPHRKEQTSRLTPNIYIRLLNVNINRIDAGFMLEDETYMHSSSVDTLNRSDNFGRNNHSHQCVDMSEEEEMNHRSTRLHVWCACVSSECICIGVGGEGIGGGLSVCSCE